MANVTLKAKLVLRNDTESNWIKANPVLIKGEMGYCTDKQYLKIGDGTKVFTMLPKNTLGKVILFDDPPTDEDAKKWEPGTIFMHIMTTPPTLYMVTWSDDLERVLQQIVTVESFDALGVMQQDKYAKSAGAGPDTGYVDKALMADKLKTASDNRPYRRRSVVVPHSTEAVIFQSQRLYQLPKTTYHRCPSIKSGMQVRRHRAMSAPPPDRYRYWMLPAN
ncbi:MAG: hypothetical protein ACLUQ6_12800 [Alistipes onderdonkii]